MFQTLMNDWLKKHPIFSKHYYIKVWDDGCALYLKDFYYIGSVFRDNITINIGYEEVINAADPKLFEKLEFILKVVLIGHDCVRRFK